MSTLNTYCHSVIHQRPQASILVVTDGRRLMRWSRLLAAIVLSTFVTAFVSTPVRGDERGSDVSSSGSEKSQLPDRPSDEKIEMLIRELGSDRLSVRESATKALIAAGPWSAIAVREALRAPDSETRVRATRILPIIRDNSVRALEQLGADISQRPDRVVVTVALPRSGKHQFTNESLVHLRAFPDLQYLHIHKAPVTDDGLREVSLVTSLQGITLDATDVTDAGLEHLRPLVHLRTIQLTNSKAIHGSGFGSLGTLGELEVISIYRCPITDEHLSEAVVDTLAQLPKLRRLALSETSLTDDCFLVLRRLDVLPTELSLHLADSTISDAGLKHLSGMRNLSGLSLARTKVTDDGIAYLLKMPALYGLDLSDLDVSYTVLKNLADLSSLRVLNLYRVKVSLSEIKRLERVLPNVMIYWSPKEPDNENVRPTK